jgi:hypothetical protein
MTDRILLGFEVGSGEPVYLPLHHLAIFGMTQLSGKTTALEALISRSGLKAIAFKTKRGEGGFTTYNQVTPYYRPRADWQFVEGLVNVALGEKVKYEPGMRYAIMKVCRGRKDLKEIQQAARDLAKGSKREFMKSVYEKLDAYLDIVIPELEKWVFVDSLELSEGVNVMDLSGMRLETQHLVIASTIEYAFASLDHIIVIIPEAWETIPQGKMTPVKWVAQQFIRKGAALGNYLWLDSQDIGGIDKTPLRQCDNWLMGRMKEAHEVERILKQLLGAKVPAEEIQTLALGHFYAAIGNDVKKVYVLPGGVPEDVGKEVALGKRSPESVREEFLKVKVIEGDEVFREKCEDLEKRVRTLEEEKRELALTLAQLNPNEVEKTREELLAFRQQLEQDKAIIERLERENRALAKLKEALSEFMLTCIPTPIPTEGSNPVGAVGLQKVKTIIPLEEAQLKVPTIRTDTLKGKILALAKKGNLDTWRQLGEIVKLVEEEHWNASTQEVNNALNDLAKEDLIAKKHTDRNYYCLAQGVVFEGKKEAS